MELWNSGTVTVDQDLSKELVGEIDAILGGDKSVYVGGRYITFNDSTGYLLNTLNSLSELLARNNYSIVEGSCVSFYGDQEGYHIWSGKCFETMDPGEYAVYTLTDEELCNIARRRGFCICKKTTVCPPNP